MPKEEPRVGLFKRVDTVFVPVLDVARSERWYKEVFGFRVVYRSANGDYVGFRFDEPGPLTTGLTIYRVDRLPRHRHIPFNFFTEEIGQVRDHLEKLRVPMSEVKAGGGMRFFDVEDPDGNVLGVVTFDEPGSIKREADGRCTGELNGKTRVGTVDAVLP